MKASGIESTRLPRPCLATIGALVVALSIIGRGSAFTGIARPMSNLNHRVSSSRSGTRAATHLSKADARTCIRTTPQMAAGSSGEEEVGFVEKVTAAWGTVIEQVRCSPQRHHELDRESVE